MDKLPCQKPKSVCAAVACIKRYLKTVFYHSLLHLVPSSKGIWLLPTLKFLFPTIQSKKATLKLFFIDILFAIWFLIFSLACEGCFLATLCVCVFVRVCGNGKIANIGQGKTFCNFHFTIAKYFSFISFFFLFFIEHCKKYFCSFISARLIFNIKRQFPSWSPSLPLSLHLSLV